MCKCVTPAPCAGLGGAMFSPFPIMYGFTFQRLKAALHYTVGRLCQKLGEDNRREFSRQVIAAIAETTFRQCGECQQASLGRTMCYM